MPDLSFIPLDRLESEWSIILVLFIIVVAGLVFKSGLMPIFYGLRDLKNGVKTPGQLDEFQKNMDTSQTLLQNALNQIEALSLRVNDQDSRISSLEKTLNKTQKRLLAAMAFIQELLNFIKRELPHHTNVPQMPPFLSLFDDEDDDLDAS